MAAQKGTFANQLFDAGAIFGRPPLSLVVPAAQISATPAPTTVLPPGPTVISAQPQAGLTENTSGWYYWDTSLTSFFQIVLPVNIRGVFVKTDCAEPIKVFRGQTNTGFPMIAMGSNDTAAVPVADGTNSVTLSTVDGKVSTGIVYIFATQNVIEPNYSYYLGNGVTILNFPKVIAIKNDSLSDWEADNTSAPLYITAAQDLGGVGNNVGTGMAASDFMLYENKVLAAVREARVFSTNEVTVMPELKPNIFGGVLQHTQQRFPLTTAPMVPPEPWPILYSDGDIWLLAPFQYPSARWRTILSRPVNNFGGLNGFGNDGLDFCNVSRIVLTIWNNSLADVEFGIHGRIVNDWPSFWFEPITGGFGETGLMQLPFIFKQPTSLRSTNPIYYTHPVLAIRGDVTDLGGSLYKMASGTLAIFELDPSPHEVAGGFATEGSLSMPHTLLGYSIEQVSGMLIGGVDGNGGFLPVITAKFYCDNTLPLITPPT